MHRILGVVSQLVGIGVCATGFAMLHVWLGVVVAGVGLFAVGVELERESETAPRSD